jgi:hypothetical protein
MELIFNISRRSKIMILANVFEMYMDLKLLTSLIDLDLSFFIGIICVMFISDGITASMLNYVHKWHINHPSFII